MIELQASSPLAILTGKNPTLDLIPIALSISQPLILTEYAKHRRKTRRSS